VPECPAALAAKVSVNPNSLDSAVQNRLLNLSPALKDIPLAIGAVAGAGFIFDFDLREF
jgi:hypothetical protein